MSFAGVRKLGMPLAFIIGFACILSVQSQDPSTTTIMPSSQSEITNLSIEQLVHVPTNGTPPLIMMHPSFIQNPYKLLFDNLSAQLENAMYSPSTNLTELVFIDCVARKASENTAQIIEEIRHQHGNGTAIEDEPLQVAFYTMISMFFEELSDGLNGYMSHLVQMMEVPKPKPEIVQKKEYSHILPAIGVCVFLFVIVFLVMLWLNHQAKLNQQQYNANMPMEPLESVRTVPVEAEVQETRL